jgi:hypothetical protein
MANTTTVVHAWQNDALDTVGPSGFPCQIVRGCTRTTMWHPDSSEPNRIVRIDHHTVRHHVEPSRRLGRTIRIRIRRTYYFTIYTNFLHTTTTVRSSPTYLSHNAPYDHRSVNILDRPRKEGRHNNVLPNEPHNPESSGLPLDTIEKIREQMAKIF